MLLVICIFFALFFFSQVRPGQSLIPAVPVTAVALTASPVDNTQNNLPTGVPDPAPTPSRVIELEPSIPDRDKAYLWIEHPDGSQDEVRLTGDMMAAYISHLPPGDRAVSDAPPQSMVGVQLPDPSVRPIH